MNRHSFALASLLWVLFTVGFVITVPAQVKPGRDPNQPIDDEYTKKIRE